jgi:hypothetical protein
VDEIPEHAEESLDRIEEAFAIFSAQREGVLKVALHPSPPAPTLAEQAVHDERAPV